MTGALVVFVGLALLVIIVISRTAVVVPQQSAFVVERLGRYRGTLDAGFHILLPFIDAIRYRHSIKEHAGEIPEQICITRDNVQVHVDGVLYLKVLNPERASYGVTDYLFAITQLAQTALRSEIGKIDLDKTFESRTQINLEVVNELDKATEPWGIKVLRYEIKNITPRPTCSPQWRSRCAPSARSAPSFSPPRASAMPPSTPPRARSSRSSRPPRRRGSSRSTRPRGRPRPSSPSPRRPRRASARSPTRSACRVASKRCSCASPSSTSGSSVSWRRRATPSSCPRP